MRKMLCYIIVFLLPLSMTMMVVRKANGVDEFGSFNIIYDYIQIYPVDSVNDFKELIVNIDSILLENAEFSPDWSGNVFEDIAEVGKLIADAFTVLFNFLKWQLFFIYDFFVLLVDSLLWIFNFPGYVINN